MMMLKACTRCGGDLQETQDIYGAYRQCLQCGHTVDVPDVPIVKVARKTASETEVAA